MDDLDDFFSLDPIEDIDFGDVASAPGASGTSSILDMFKSGAGTAKDIYVAVRQAQAQSDVISLNQERVKRGLPPISAESLSPQVNVGMSPSTKRLLTMIALGGGVLYLLRR